MIHENDLFGHFITGQIFLAKSAQIINRGRFFRLQHHPGLHSFAAVGIGDPRQATKAKGEEYFRAVTDKLARLMMELAAVDPDKLYT